MLWLRADWFGQVHGDVGLDEVKINEAIGRDSVQRELMCVKQQGDKTGKSAQTICRVRERYGNYSLVELQLLTGRTHQIRVHLSHIGHPIAGDTAYGGRAVTELDLIVVKEATGVGDHRVYLGGHTAGAPILSRQALHATSIAFKHPTHKKNMKLVAPLYKVSAPPLDTHAVSLRSELAAA
jgi:23S rRNA-/tRNA-specific pseudouridylate synthase